MQVLLGLKDFGKIKSAEVDIGGFTVFVGNNNSGKTYVMQLIYGIQKNLYKYASDSELWGRYLTNLEEQAKSGKVIVDSKNVKIIENFLNDVLQRNKEKIVWDTFYEEIAIGQIYLRLFMEEDEQFEWLVYRQDDSKFILDEIQRELGEEHRKTLERRLRINREQDNEYYILRNVHISNHKKELIYEGYYNFIPSVCMEFIYSTVHIIKKRSTNKLLFLPPSRTGLMVLYKDFFANKADEAVQIFRAEDAESRESQKMGMTQPVYDFLRFIQTFRMTGKLSESMDSFVRFMEAHLMEGKILMNQGNQPVYQTQGAKRELPLYLSSSMVNELLPVLYILQSVDQPRNIIWDEIETSLHPQKQMELARLLSRMCNAGFSMIVSTHSDTMAAKINNLCLLSFSQALKAKRVEILKKAGLEEADLFRERIHVYQFENDDSGRSLIRELEYDEVTGYQFTLFQDSVEKLFQETRLILE